MKISLNWLQKFVELTENDNEKIKEVITARSAEIETMEDTGAHLENVVLGRVEQLKPHPNADKLKIAMVNDGQNVIQVVCGGSNLKEGMKVVYAQLGAVVKWHGNEVIKMEKIKLRGEESSGMICASEEVGIEDIYPTLQEKGITDLSHIDAPVGTPLAKILGLDDVVIDIDNHAITNRPDLFSHRGFAREFVACGLAKWKKNAIDLTEVKAPNSPAPIDIKMTDAELCSNYLGVYLTDFEIKESPEWLKKHLTACGVRPISNLVDITNYVMLELGMPIHAFDLEQIKGKTWTMRPSKKEEKIITLDEKTFELFENITVFDDGNELFDLCGVMGGLHSGVNQKTNKVWLHAPVYNPILIRKAMRGLGQISDAAIIYEKGVDNALAMDGLKRAIELITELCPQANIASKITHIKNYQEESRVIELKKDRLNQMIGITIPEQEVMRILNDLGFTADNNKEAYRLTVPTWRYKDINIEADLIEEVARVYGYDQIKPVLPMAHLKPVANNSRREFERSIKNELVTFGFNEIYTFAFTGPELIEKSGLTLNDSSIEVTNPISSDMSIMRQSLLPRTLETIASNLRYRKALKVFEIGRVYDKKADHPVESSSAILATIGDNFRCLQGVIENFKLELKPINGKSESHQHPGRCAQLIKRGQLVGFIYQLHPIVAKNFDIKTEVIIAEINLEAIHAMNLNHRLQYSEIPKYPAVQLDISLLIPKKTLAENYYKAIQKANKTLIQNIEVIDEYTGDKIKADQRSLTYSITYRSNEGTLTEDQVSEIHQQVIKNLQGVGAIIRD